MRQTRIRVVIGVTCLALAAVGQAQSVGTTGQSGMQINLDPATGELIKQPATQPVKHSARVAEDEPLEVTNGPTAAHGQMIDLKGRHHHQMTVQVGTDGKPVSGNCEQKN